MPFFYEDQCMVFNKKNMEMLMTVKMTSNKMFPIKFSEHSINAFNVETCDIAWLWHKRYGHLNFGGLDLLHKQNLVVGLPMVQKIEDICESCVYGKQHRVPFQVGKSWRANEPLMLVHADICGPIQTSSLGESRYFLLFVDDLTRMCWVYFLKQKSEAFSSFVQFRAYVEKQSGYAIKILRTDRGGEFTSKEFFKYCKDAGIRRELTASFTPQQNGVAERKNRSIVETSRSMLKEKGLPKSFWAEAVSTSIYLLNRSPTKAVTEKTPYETWFGRKPNVSHLKVFGSIAYAHIPFEKRQKLDEKSIKCIFVGYSDETKGYRLYNPENKELIISRDVIFNENDAWKWEVNVEKSPLIIEEEETSSFEFPPDTPPSLMGSPKSETLPRKVRSLHEIYQHCDFALFASEPTCF